MSIHSSLRSGADTETTRSVLKRHERVRRLIEQGKWQEGGSVFGLPKLKQIKVKLRKAAAKEKTEAAAEGAAAAPEAGAAPAAAAKPAAKSAAKPAAKSA